MQPFIGTVSRKPPTGNRRAAEHHEELAPVAISHNIGRPLDRFFRGSVRCHPQSFDDCIQHRMAQHWESNVPCQQERHRFYKVSR